MKHWYLNLPNSVRAAVNTAWQSFVGVFALTLLGFLDDVKEWAGCTGTCQFPSVSPLGKAVGAAAVAALSGVVTLVFRSLKPGPQYSTDVSITTSAGTFDVMKSNDKGQSTLHIVLIVLAIIALAIFIFSRVSFEDDSSGAIGALAFAPILRSSRLAQLLDR